MLLFYPSAEGKPVVLGQKDIYSGQVLSILSGECLLQQKIAHDE